MFKKNNKEQKMAVTKDRQNSFNKQELFMEEKPKEREGFLKNIEKYG